MKLDQAVSAPRAPDPARRTLALSAIGAVAGLALAGYALFTAGGTTANSLPPQDVALVNNRPILQSDFVTQTQIETGSAFRDTTAAERQRVLGEMIDEELLVQRGLDVDLAASDPDVRSAMVAGVNLQVDAEVLATQPDAQALRAYYTAHAARYTIDGAMDLRDLVASAPSADAAALVAALRAGMDVDAAAAKFGFAESGRIGHGDNYDFGVKAKLGEALYQAAAGLKDGQVAGPVRDGGAVHVLVMLRRKPITQLGFDAARDTVWQDMQREARARVERANLDFLRGRAEIRVAPGFSP
jgi:parvulin-like peptidyl-prolyl isomerase